MPIEIQGSGLENGRMQRLLAHECPKEALTIRNEGDFIAFSNSLQGVLALRKFGDDAEHSKSDEWFQDYSIRFRRVFEETILRDPLYFSRYDTLGNMPEEIWEELETETYE
jgi:hypothetical protein